MTTNLRQRFANFLNTIDTAHHEYYTNAVGDFLDWLEAPPVQAAPVQVLEAPGSPLPGAGAVSPKVSWPPR